MNFESRMGGDLLVAERVDDAPQAPARRHILIAAAAGAAFLLLVALWLGWKQEHPAVTKPVGTQIPNVTVIVAQPTGVSRSANGTGSIAARRDMPVGVVGEGGRVLDVLVEPGAWVSKGQVLARIERSVQQQQTASLAAQVDVARANAKLAEANLTRARGLVGSGFISRADLESKVATRDSAVAQLNVAIAQLNQSRASMARLDIRAPENGLVLTRSVEPGQVVTGGAATLFRIARDGQMEMQLALNAADMANVRVNDRAMVTPVGATRSVAGTVWQVSPVVDVTTKQGIVRILMPYDDVLRPGAFAQATVTTGHASGVVLPESAVQSDPKGNYVYVVDANKRVARRDVVTGPVTDAGVAIVRGLTGGERVVATAGGFLSVGDRVNPVRAPAR